MSLESWQEKSATVGGMVLVDDCDILDWVERADILAQLPPLEGMDILELGAGIGRYTSHFVQVARHVIAVDFVEKFIEENRRATAHFNNASYLGVTSVYSTEVMSKYTRSASIILISTIGFFKGKCR